VSFDDVLLRELDDLVTLWPKVLALLRVEPSLRLLDAFPLRDADTLGRITQNGGDLVADDKGAPGLLEQVPDLRVISVDSVTSEVLGLGDEVHLLAGLGVDPLDCRSTKGSTRDHRQRYCVPSFHDDIPPNRPTPNSSVRG